jgi:hypothetical protein
MTAAVFTVGLATAFLLGPSPVFTMTIGLWCWHWAWTNTTQQRPSRAATT